MTGDPAMAATVTIERITYRVEKLDNGNIRVTHDEAPRRPMFGPGTDGVHMFEVHPCQTAWYAFWNDHLPPEARQPAGEATDPPLPWWSSKGWKKARAE